MRWANDSHKIPLSGRICAIADVFDALTSDRPYKVAWSLEDTMEEIIKGKGTQFDPNLVDVTLELVDEMLEIKNQYIEPT